VEVLRSLRRRPIWPDVELMPRTDADFQTSFQVRHVQIGIWLASGGYLLCALRLVATGYPVAAALVFGALGGVGALGLLLPLRALLRRRYAPYVLFAAVMAHLPVLMAYLTIDRAALLAYPAVSTMLTVYVGAVFGTRAVTAAGALVVAGYPALALPAGAGDPALTIGICALLAINAGLCAGISRNRTRHEAIRRRADLRTEALLEQSSDAILAIDHDGVVCYQSPSATTLLGYRGDQLLGTPLTQLVHPGDTPAVGRWLTGLLDGPAGGRPRVEARLRTAEGDWSRTEVSGANRFADRAVGAAVVNIRDVGSHRDLEEQLTRQALRDPLTGLANRALLRDRVEHAVDRGRRTAATVALLLIDLDDFKFANDAVGHALGDQLLVTIAERLGGYVRPSDTLARLGADEFALLVEDRIDEMTAMALGARLLEAVRPPVRLGQRDVSVTASIGVAVIKAGVSGAVDADELLRDAHLALYAAKTAGRDRCLLFDPAMHVDVLREVEQRADLERAVAEEQFVVQYQPIVDLPTLELIGVEALVRWQHPSRGMIGPAEFIPLAESTGLIVPLGLWVLKQACAQVVQWQANRPDTRRLRISVNLSARQFQCSGLVADVAGVLSGTGIAPAQVVLEITESLLMLDTEATVATLHELKSLGVRLAIDDFDRVLSLSCLRRFPWTSSRSTVPSSTASPPRPRTPR
jgi:diguanylate cyclase (GGDEF)-like protein/PAS domain S-box-containing protein